MIKVGDKLLIKDEVYIIQNESYNDNKVEAKCVGELKFVEMEFDTALGYAFAYEKQRADELEKRWSELREHVIARSDACKERRMIRERDALIDVMAAMHDLEEDDNA